MKYLSKEQERQEVKKMLSMKKRRISMNV